MDPASRTDVGRDTGLDAATASSPSRSEAVVTAAAGLGIVCAVAAAAGAWMLMTDPDRLMWAAAGDAGSMATLITRTAALLASAALALVGS